MRADLLSLSLDDLELFSNKGTVRRAAAEVEEGEPALLKFDECDDSLKFDWADPVTCNFRAGADVRKGVCSCSSVTVCRHLIRSVLAYQKMAAQSGSTAIIESEPSDDGTLSPNLAGGVEREPSIAGGAVIAGTKVQEPWWPGDISDDALAQNCKKAVLKAAEVLFAKGQVVRLSAGLRPRANFLSLSHSVRFLVPSDIRYAVCDCSDDAPCVHAALAVMSFRLGDASRNIQFVETSYVEVGSIEVLNEIEECLNAILLHGLSSTDKEAVRLLSQSRERCESSGFFFLSEIFEEIILFRERILASDASVSPESLMLRIAELLIRIDVAKGGRVVKDLPLSLVLGGKWNAPIALKALSLVSLGIEAVQKRRQTELVCHFVDIKNGQLCRVVRTFVHSQDIGRSLPLFEDLARVPMIKANSIGDLSASSIVVRGGKLSPSRQLMVGRNPLSISPQDYDWTRMHASVYFEDLAELVESLVDVHPPYLSARSEATSVRVARVESCSDSGFNYSDQCLLANIYDKNGASAILKLPYKTRAAKGFELALELLADKEHKLEFISGTWSNYGFNIEVKPLTMVFIGPNGRSALQPDIGRCFNIDNLVLQSGDLNPVLEEVGDSGQRPVLPSSEILRCLGILSEKGLIRPDPLDLKLLDELRQDCARLGAHLLCDALTEVIGAYQRRAVDVDNSSWRQELLSKVKVLIVTAFVVDRESAMTIDNSEQLVPFGI